MNAYISCTLNRHILAMNKKIHDNTLMNLLHDIVAGDPTKLVNVVIEIPIGSQTKFEYHDDVKTIVVDRFLYTAFSYPFNYGFIPQTWSDDEDALDIVVLSSQPIPTGVVIECRVIGMINTEDEEGGDPKLIAVPKAKIDPVYADIDDVSKLPEHIKAKVTHFYENYKTIEPGKWVKITGWTGKDEAVKTVEESIKRYQQHFKK
jgi:inorganic pyrophosphatase